MACSFSLPFKGSRDSFIAASEDGIKKQGGVVHRSSANTGTFTVPSPAGDIEVAYTLGNGIVNFTADDLPFLVPCSAVKENLTNAVNAYNASQAAVSRFSKPDSSGAQITTTKVSSQGAAANMNQGEISSVFSVRTIQKKLNALGAKISEDGVWGPQTKGAFAEAVSQLISTSKVTTYLSDGNKTVSIAPVGVMLELNKAIDAGRKLRFSSSNESPNLLMVVGVLVAVGGAIALFDYMSQPEELPEELRV